jgi:hypothetical protein
LIPFDCTCCRPTNELSAAGLKRIVVERHRESVVRAYRSGWPEGSAPTHLRRRAAG